METHIDNNDYRSVDARELTEGDVQKRVTAIDAKAWSAFEKTVPAIDDQITTLLSDGWLLDNERHRTLYFRKQKPYPRSRPPNRRPKACDYSLLIEVFDLDRSIIGKWTTS